MDPYIVAKAAPYTGPFDASGTLLDSVTAAPAEGIWLPAQFLKNMSVEVTGSGSGQSVQLYGSNALAEPGNQQTITIGGTVATGDVLTLAFKSAVAGTINVNYTTVGGDTTSTIATALAAAINANATLATDLGVSASAASAVITVSWPSETPAAAADNVPAGFNSSVTQPLPANFLSVTGSTTGSEIFTIANGSTGTAVGSAITANGVTQFAGNALRWIKARLTALTSGSVTINFYGVG